MTERVPNRLLARIAARRANRAEGVSPDAYMTEEDRANLAEFEADVAAVTEVLFEEIAAIEAGRIELVTDLYPRKAELLKRIEVLMPVIEPFLRGRIEVDAGLRDRLGALQAAVQTDGELLKRIAEATTTILHEVDKIRDRHSLNGLYGKQGKRRGVSARASHGIDKSL